MAFVAVLALSMGSGAPARAADHRRAGFAERHDHDQWRAVAATAAEVRRHDRAHARAVQTLLAGARRAAQGCAQRAADHHRRFRLRHAEHLRRRRPDTGARPRGGERPALHQLPLDGAVFTDARRADHRPQPPLGRLRRDLPRQPPATPATTVSYERDKATIGKILKDNGYRTSWFGKDHNTPAFQAARMVRSTSGRPAWASSTSTASSAATPTSGSRPTCSATPRYIYPFIGKPGCNLTTAMADDAIAYMNRINALDAGPAVLHQVRAGWRACAASPDQGVDRQDQQAEALRQGLECKLREQIFENQKRLGVIPANAKLTPWPKDLLKEWDTLSADEKKMFIRQVEVSSPPSWRTPTRDRPRHPGRRGSGQARQHAGDLHQRRQRRQRRRSTLVGTPNEVAMFNGSRCRSTTSSSTSTTSGAPRRPTTTWPCPGRGRSTRRSPGPSRSPRTSVACAGHGDHVAEGDHRQGRHSPPVPPRDRHRADHPGSGEDQAAEGRRWHQAEPDRGREHAVHLRQGQRKRAIDAQDAVLRDDGRPCHLP
jgi:hypothetical protein